MVRVMAVLPVVLAVLTACSGSPHQDTTEDPDSAGHVIAYAPLDDLDLRPTSPEALQTLRGYLQKTTLPQGPTHSRA